MNIIMDAKKQSVPRVQNKHPIFSKSILLPTLGDTNTPAMMIRSDATINISDNLTLIDLPPPIQM